jgi:hypothetical protein
MADEIAESTYRTADVPSSMSGVHGVHGLCSRAKEQVRGHMRSDCTRVHETCSRSKSAGQRAYLGTELGADHGFAAFVHEAKMQVRAGFCPISVPVNKIVFTAPQKCRSKRMFTCSPLRVREPRERGFSHSREKGAACGFPSFTSSRSSSTQSQAERQVRRSE